jgi:hypothetical protein
MNAGEDRQAAGAEKAEADCRRPFRPSKEDEGFYARQLAEILLCFVKHPG